MLNPLSNISPIRSVNNNPFSAAMDYNHNNNNSMELDSKVQYLQAPNLTTKANNLFNRATAWYEESIREENEFAETDEGGGGAMSS